MVWRLPDDMSVVETQLYFEEYLFAAMPWIP